MKCFDEMTMDQRPFIHERAAVLSLHCNSEELRWKALIETSEHLELRDYLLVDAIWR